MSSTRNYTRRQRELCKQIEDELLPILQSGISYNKIYAWLGVQIGRTLTCFKSLGLGNLEKILEILQTRQDELLQFKNESRPLWTEAKIEFKWLVNFNNMTLDQAYQWLGEQLGIEKHYYFPELSEEQITKAIKVIRARRMALYARIATLRKVS